MIVIDCTMEELRELLAGKEIPLYPNGPLMRLDPDNDAGRQAPAAEQDEPLPSRMELLKKAIGRSEEFVWTYFAEEFLDCKDCPAQKKCTGNKRCRNVLEAWLHEDPQLKGEI